MAMINHSEIVDFIVDAIKKQSRFSIKTHVNWHGRVTFYMCIQLCFINNEYTRVIHLDSFSVTKQKYLGTGNMRNILALIKEISVKYNTPIVINSVISNRLCDFLCASDFIAMNAINPPNMIFNPKIN